MILKRFDKLVLDKFSKILEKHDFQLARNRIEKYFCEIIYANNMLYVTFQANINPRDRPPYFNILLGEGPIEWPDYDWNNVALWHFAKQDKKNNHHGEYLLGNSLELEDDLKKAKNDLMKYGRDFLNGDLSCFYKIRKDINKKREPYKIYISNKKGVCSDKYDKVSMKMREKYT